jgi:hypothetical protein
MLWNTEEAFKNGCSGDTGNVGNTRSRAEIKKNKKQTNINTHGKLKPFEKIDDCSLCGYWWNCCPSLLQLSFLNLSKDLR